MPTLPLRGHLRCAHLAHHGYSEINRPCGTDRTVTFLLQNYYVKDWAGNFMMHLMVSDADVWWKHIQDIKLAEKYADIMCKPPTLQPWVFAFST